MSDEGYGATVAKRRLSHRLSVLRKRSGHTANHVCDMLNWGRGKVGRFEANQWKRPEMGGLAMVREFRPRPGKRLAGPLEWPVTWANAQGGNGPVTSQ